jgi:CRISPR/Cas system CSM-associated protein Csm3 (group 7 of RAMP superfamily)
MKIIELTIELKEDTVISENAATEGGHKSLNFIPGSTLLGSAASRLYRQFTNANAWQVFHSGKVRFTNGYPLSPSGQQSYPAPFCWHHSKDDASTIYNGTSHFTQANIQPKQVRSGFYTDDFESVKVNLGSRMKTAIDPKTRMAKDAQLFDYAFIEAGHQFSATIQIDDDVDHKIVDDLLKHFNGTLLLGRSRSAEYGKVSVSAILKTTTPLISSDKNTLSIWLQSDLCLLDNHGQPNLFPQCLSMLDDQLPKASLDLSQSFIRKRSYNVWNAFKRGYDTERHVIVAGSVLTYQLEIPLTHDQNQLLMSGVGLYRENGLGQVLVNRPHTLLDSFNVKATIEVKTSSTLPAVSHPLVGWLISQHEGKTGFDDIRQKSKYAAKTLYSFYESNRRMLGLDNGIAVGPSKSQWGSVLAAAKTANSNKSLKEKLFDGADAIVKESKPGWKDKFWNGDKLTSFDAWFEKMCRDYQGDLVTYLQHFAHEAQQTLNTTQKGAK